MLSYEGSSARRQPPVPMASISIEVSIAILQPCSLLSQKRVLPTKPCQGYRVLNTELIVGYARARICHRQWAVLRLYRN